MNTLRQQYLDTLKDLSRKQLVSKSASGPQLYAVRNGAGELLGFFPGETIPPEVVRQQLQKEEVCKSARDDDANGLGLDKNSVFDDSPLLPEFQSIGASREVSKGAEIEPDPNSELIGIFPPFLR